jgi:DNA polymerase bacteriophage-type
VENIVQGVARDIMANGMWNVERAGYPVVSTVHDEVLAELEDGKGELTEYVATLCRLPAWARGCPITAEGFETQRYRKD